ncbi:AAA family ATPase [Tessaracoccus aquimaris]|uniref:AAA family ATPase n=1 Tax=Tessaracoccus aquimaris TaxID=1332264 RepID=UPI000988A3C8|nr:AAA family ATPase [Tessaracoccus aquimaris]
MPELPIAATGTLLAFAEAGMLRLIDFHLARRLAQLTGEADPELMLACALAVRELRLGSVCVDLASAAERLQPEADLDDGAAEAVPVALPWPEADAWLARVAASPTVATDASVEAPFRLDGTLLYLDRYWRQERSLADLLRARSAVTVEPVPVTFAVDEVLDEQQRDAVTAALGHLTTVITGGPGTGKTTIVAKILEALGPVMPRVALCAPTGKAAARLLQEVGGATGHTWGGTLHKLLGLRPRSAHSEYGPRNPLPYDVVVVDETSMVSLELMATLLAALSERTRLILLGDPHQLRSVEAGAVLADIESADDLVTAPAAAWRDCCTTTAPTPRSTNSPTRSSEATRRPHGRQLRARKASR